MDRLGKSIILLAKEVYQSEGYYSLIEWLKQFDGRTDVTYEIEECIQVNRDTEIWWGPWESCNTDHIICKNAITGNFGGMNIKTGPEIEGHPFKRLHINREKLKKAYDKAYEEEKSSKEDKKSEE